MATLAIDVPYLSHYSNLPEPNIHALIDSPTTDLVITFLQQVIHKAQEHDRLQAERLRLDVELESAVRDGELRARTIRATADKALQEADALRKQLNEEGRSDLPSYKK